MNSRFPGGFLYWSDLSQIELRVAAVLSGDPVLVRNYKEKLNLHNQAAVEMFGEACLKDPLFKKKYYPAGKTRNFADLNLASAKVMRDSLLQDTGIDLPLAFFEGVVNRRPTERPGLWKFQRDLITRACKDKFIELPFTGHSRQFRGTKHQILDQESTIVNFPIQTHAAITTQRIQIEFEKLCIRHRLPCVQTCNIYDAWVVDCPPGYESTMAVATEEAVQIVRDTYWSDICKHYGNAVPLEYESEVLPNREARP